MDYFYAMILSQFIATNTFIISEIFAFITRIIGIKCFTQCINNRTVLTDNIKKGFYTSEYSDIPTGIFLGRWYIGRSLEDGGRQYRKITIFCTQAHWDFLNGKTERNKFSFKMSTFSNANGLREIQYKKLEPRENQRQIIEHIKDLYDEQNYVTALMTGSPGTGKTKTAVLLAQHYSSTLFRANIEIGIDGIDSAHQNIGPTLRHPLIVLFDEFDETVNKMFSQDIIQKSKKNSDLDDDFSVSRLCKFDKRSWNALFDAINDGMFPYTIFILASNVSKEEIDRKNNSLLRAGRLNMYIKLEKDNVEIIDEKDFVPYPESLNLSGEISFIKNEKKIGYEDKKLPTSSQKKRQKNKKRGKVIATYKL